MRRVLEAIAGAFARGEDAVLATVAAAAGSVPRGSGAMMTVLADGMAGTVGGGAVEYACLQLGRDLLGKRASGIRSYSLSNTRAAELGMVCGGDVDMLFAYLDHAQPAAQAWLEAALAAFDAAEDVWLVLCLCQRVVTPGLYDACHGVRFAPVSADTVQPMAQAMPVFAGGEEDGLFVTPLVEAGTVLIFGGGHVSRALVPVLGPLSFRTQVLEDRAEFVAGGVLCDYARIGDSVAISPADYAVIMTRGHQSDAVVLAQVLRTRARYVGMIGSRRKIVATFDNLRAQGFGDADFARVHSPIGLSIGARTPEEIAISIAAEMIQVRASGR